MGREANTTLDAALTEDWLSRGDQGEQFYGALRDRLMPGKPMWYTETAQTACGGDRWASTFVDGFRYLNQLGDLAKRGVQVQAHNTLAASDYGLLQEYTFEPRPNYWSALLWRKLMGTTVLEASDSPAASLHLYAQCLRNHPGGVALLAINASETDAQSLHVPVKSKRYTLTARELTDHVVQLNGVDLKLGADDSLPELKGQSTHAGAVTLAPNSIPFLAMPNAHNAVCGQSTRFLSMRAERSIALLRAHGLEQLERLSSLCRMQSATSAQAARADAQLLLTTRLSNCV